MRTDENREVSSAFFWNFYLETKGRVAMIREKHSIAAAQGWLKSGSIEDDRACYFAVLYVGERLVYLFQLDGFRDELIKEEFSLTVESRKA